MKPPIRTIGELIEALKDLGVDPETPIALDTGEYSDLKILDVRKARRPGLAPDSPGQFCVIVEVDE